MKLIDISGQRFGRLVVIEKSGYKGDTVAWKCKCDCGNELRVRGKDLRRGFTQSCGCMRREKLVQQNTRHGLHGSRLYNVWGLMVQRCYNPNTPCYSNYGGRGIAISPEWRESFKSFSDWAIHNGYSDDLTIDRIDNSKGYFPENCRWVTRKIQANNTRRNHLITYNSVTHTLSEWADVLGMSPDTLGARIYRGWTVDKALTTPLRTR